MNDVEVIISDVSREITINLSSGHTATSVEFMKFCFKSKKIKHESIKNTTFSFAEQFIRSSGGNDDLEISNFTTLVHNNDDWNSPFGVCESQQNVINFAEFFKKFKEVYGVSAAVLRKIISQKVLSVMIHNSEDFPNRSKYVNALCKGSNSRTHLRKLFLLNDNKDSINSLERDGLKNIIPFILWFSELLPPNGVGNSEEFNKQPAKAMKKIFGKSLWKKLTKNTFTRNSLLCKNSYDISSLKMLIDLEIPSTVLKYNRREIFWLLQRIPRVINYLSNPNLSDDINDSLIISKLKNFIDNYRVSDKLERRRLFRDLHLVSDTINAYDLNRVIFENINFDHRTSLFDILLKHDEVFEIRRNHQNMTRNIITPNKPLDFSWISNYFQKSGEINNTPYVVLDSPEIIRREALGMSHCLDSYITRIGRGNYLAVHLGEKAPSGITVGFSCVNGRLILNQAYGYDNEIISESDDKLVKALSNQLNKEYTISLQECA